MEGAAAPGRRYYRTTQSDHWIAGVCGGFARYFSIDPVLVRILWLVLTVFSIGLGAIGYLIVWLVAPREEDAGRTP